MACCRAICYEWLIRNDDPPDDITIKKGMGPIFMSLLPIFAFLMWYEMTTTKNVTFMIAFVVLTTTALSFLAGSKWIRGSAVYLIDGVALGLAVGILALDMYLASEARPRAWAMVVLVLDATLVYNRPRPLPIVLSGTLLYLFVEAAESTARVGLYDAVATRPPPVCECAQPPCGHTVVGACGQLLLAVVVLLVDFRLTRRFATDLRLQLSRVNASVEVAGKIAEALSRYEVEKAQVEVEDQGEALPEELRESFRVLLDNLFRYRPYLPAALFASSEEEEEEEEEAVLVSEPGSPSSPGGESLCASGRASSASFRSGRQASLANPEKNRQANKLQKMSELQLKSKRCTLQRASAVVQEAGAFENVTEQVSEFVTTFLHGAQAHKGVLLTLGADHLLVGWNTHAPLPTHAHNGVMCALNLQSSLCHLPVKSPGVAVCSGSAYVGTAGLKEVFIAPVVVGKLFSLSVQLARLPPTLQSGCVCDEGAYENTRGEVVARVVDVVRVEDKDSFVYELVGRREHVKELYTNEDSVTRYTSAFSAMRQLKWDRAQSRLEEQLQRYPSDAQSLRLLRICQAGAPPFDTAGRSQYSRVFAGWPDYEGSSQRIELPEVVKEAVLRARASDSPEPETNRRDSRKVGFTDVQVFADDEDAIKKAIEFNRKRESQGAVGEGLPRELVDQQGRKYYRGNRALGKGAFGEVFVGMAGNGGLVALKSLLLPDTLRKKHRSSFEELSTVQVPAGGLFPFRSVEDESNTVSRGTHISDLLKEVTLMCSLRHENIVSYLGTAVCREHLVVVLEYVPGGSLHSLMRQFDGQLPMTSVQRYLNDTMNGLVYLHAREVVHRDLKTDNVLIAADGTGKLADFGASESMQKLAGEQDVTGTPHYMSPEQCRGEAEAASDVWSLGIMAAELIIGRLPWPSGTMTGFTFITEMGRPETKLHPDFTKVEEFGQLALEFCDDCCKRNPKERPAVKDLTSYAFMIF
eukprot:Hpha_TRINITY_DN15527_c1_g1::TRINITY_DN15527_c1_g1_i1::g.106057::m.106057